MALKCCSYNTESLGCSWERRLYLEALESGQFGTRDEEEEGSGSRGSLETIGPTEDAGSGWCRA